MIEITKLANGLTVVTDNMPSLESAAVGVWVNSGTRHETPREMGLAHVLEHMAFKGTARRSARDIAEQIEAVGGDLNAYTGREQTAYHARLLKEDVPLALDILSDILIHPAFDDTELARERDVIVQEIGSARDTPDDQVFDYLQEACYPGQPMGWPILGTEKTVQSFVRDDLSRYIGAQYRADEMVLAAAGAVNHAQLVTLAHDLFGGLNQGAVPGVVPARYDAGEIRDDDTELEQAHLTFAFPGVPAADADAMTAQVFATAFGGGMSSRLFQEAREKRGLCYSISAFAGYYRDSGTIGIYCGTAAEKAGEIAPIIAGELSAMASGATEDEIKRARAQLKASLLMGLERPHARAEMMVGHLFTYGRLLSLEEIIGRIEAVDAAAVRRFATRVCERGEPAMAAIGPIKRLESRDAFAKRFGKKRAA
jgi:predicted Zn-dependent peptidase